MPVFSNTFHVTQPYLFLPVKNGSAKFVFQLQRDGQLVREFDIEVDLTGSPDWWAYYDLSTFTNQTISLVLLTGELSRIEAAWLKQAIRCGEDIPGAGNLYQEALRPQFHFTPRRGWNNDPNGLLYLNGIWHMFFQHNPFGTTWGNMHWGHATSSDLLHWEEQPIALYPHSLNDMAFSGSGIVDWHNDSGFGSPGSPAAILAFTSTGRGECLAYSNDQCQSFTEYQQNPIIKHFGRDPKIIYYAPELKWVMIVYEEAKPNPAPEEQHYAIYESFDLKTWTKNSALENLYECPEMFSLPLDGDPDNIRWIVYGSRHHQSRSNCLVGHFDGRQFTPEYENESSHSGPAFYAAQIFSNAPGQRCIMIGWLRDAGYPAMPFSQGMTVPLELSLRTTPSGPRLLYYPVREFASLHTGQPIAGFGLSVDAANHLLAQTHAELLDLDLVLTSNNPFALDLRGHTLRIDPARSLVEFAGTQAHLSSTGEQFLIRVLLDRAVTEIFINQGEAAFSAMTLPTGSTQIRFNGAGSIRSLKANPIRSIWQ